MDYTIDGKCIEGCGRCCTRVLPLNDHEIKKIKQYIRRNNIKPAHLDSDMCPFLNEDKRCQVYIHRAEICKTFMCNTHMTAFNHKDKKMVDLWQEFYPEEAKDLPLTDVDLIDAEYQIKKKKVYNI